MKITIIFIEKFILFNRAVKYGKFSIKKYWYLPIFPAVYLICRHPVIAINDMKNYCEISAFYIYMQPLKQNHSKFMVFHVHKAQQKYELWMKTLKTKCVTVAFLLKVFEIIIHGVIRTK